MMQTRGSRSPRPAGPRPVSSPTQQTSPRWSPSHINPGLPQLHTLTHRFRSVSPELTHLVRTTKPRVDSGLRSKSPLAFTHPREVAANPQNSPGHRRLESPNYNPHPGISSRAVSPMNAGNRAANPTIKPGFVMGNTDATGSDSWKAWLSKEAEALRAKEVSVLLPAVEFCPYLKYKSTLNNIVANCYSFLG